MTPKQFRRIVLGMEGAVEGSHMSHAGVLTPRLDYDPASDRPRLTEVREQSLPLLPTIGARVRF